MNTKALAPIGEGGGWFGRVSEVTTAVVAVPIPCSHPPVARGITFFIL